MNKESPRLEVGSFDTWRLLRDLGFREDPSVISERWPGLRYWYERTTRPGENVTKLGGADLVPLPSPADIAITH